MDSTMSSELNKIASEIEPDVTIKPTTDKHTGLLQVGQKITCVNPVQGIYKGRDYIVDQWLEPGVVVVTETSGESVGAFRASRFCPNWNAY